MSGMRGHRLASRGGGEVSLGMMRAVVVSRSPLAIELARATRTDVFLCKDRHSDDTIYLTCHPPVVDVLRRAHHIGYQLVPEPHMAWHPRCSTHDLLRRPGCIAVNVRGEAIISDLEGNVIIMVSRHLPAQVKVVAGKWGGPSKGSAGQGPGTSMKLALPFGLAAHVVVPGKNEVCFFADAGNEAVRLLRKTHSINQTQIVSPVAVTSNPPLQPYGLACIRPAPNTAPLLVVSEEARKRVVIVQLGSSLVSGHVITVVSPDVQLLSPAALAICERSLYVADGQRVLIATLPVTADTAQQAIGPKLRLLHRGFKEVHGVAARNGRCGQIVAVADAKLHSVSILELDSGGAVAMVTVWGDGSQDARYGPSTHLALNEPVGLAFDGAVLLVGCFGGAKHGSLVAITPTEFACELLSQLHACYKACGFVSPRATKEERSARHMPIDAALPLLQGAATFFEAQCRARSELLSGHKALAGPDGSLYPRSIETLTMSVANIQTLLNDLMTAGLTHSDRLTLHALLDEGKVEVSFGEWVKASSMENPDAKEYWQRKPAIMRHSLNRLGTPPFDLHQSRNAFYQASHRSPIDTARLWRSIRRRHSQLHPRRPLRQPAAERLKVEWAHARRLIALGRHQRTASTRTSFYKRKVGVGINLLQEGSVEDRTAPGAPSRFYAEFRKKLQQWRAKRCGGAPSSQHQEQETRHTHLMLMGDVSFVAAGDNGAPPIQQGAEAEEGEEEEVREPGLAEEDREEGAREEEAEGRVVAQSELWWAIQCTKSLSAGRSTRTARSGASGSMGWAVGSFVCYPHMR